MMLPKSWLWYLFARRDQHSQNLQTARKTKTTGIYSATIFGLVSGQVGMMITPLGPLIPFLMGSTVGFGVGLWSHWRFALEKTHQYAQHYPTLLAHALWTEFRILVPTHIVQAQQIRANEMRSGISNHQSGDSSGASSSPRSSPSYTPIYNPFRLNVQTRTLQDEKDAHHNYHPMEEWVTAQGWRHLSLCTLATQQCQFDVIQVDKQERQQITEATVAALAAQNAYVPPSNNDDNDE